MHEQSLTQSGSYLDDGYQGRNEPIFDGSHAIVIHQHPGVTSMDTFAQANSDIINQLADEYSGNKKRLPDEEGTPVLNIVAGSIDLGQNWNSPFHPRHAKNTVTQLAQSIAEERMQKREQTNRRNKKLIGGGGAALLLAGVIGFGAYSLESNNTADEAARSGVQTVTLGDGEFGPLTCRGIARITVRETDIKNTRSAASILARASKANPAKLGYFKNLDKNQRSAFVKDVTNKLNDGHVINHAGTHYVPTNCK
jgi:hypothetical protein